LKKRRLVFLIVLILTFSTSWMKSFAQNPTDTFPRDPGSITVYTVQNMSFGAFTQGTSGGTISISTSGIRSSTGSVVPLNLGVQYFQANFEIEAPAGSIISIFNGPDATLVGSNGGSMSLHISNPYPMAPFSTNAIPPARTLVSFGGTLTVGSILSALPGTYRGTFSITFNQE
jgi:hypothetical protein